MNKFFGEFWRVVKETLLVPKMFSVLLWSFSNSTDWIKGFINSMDCISGIFSVLDNSRFGSVVSKIEGWFSKSMSETWTVFVLKRPENWLFNNIVAYLSWVWISLESFRFAREDDVVIKFSLKSVVVMVALVLLICDKLISVLAESVLIKTFSTLGLFRSFFWERR